MIDFFVQLILSLNGILFNNLGLTIITIGVLSRLLFHPLILSNLRYTKAARELKPKLDELKRKYGSDMKRLAAEQTKVFKEAGVNPAAGAIGCVSLLVQLVVFFVLFRALLKIIDSGVDTSFLYLDLGEPDLISLGGLPSLPGVLVAATALASFVQSKMLMGSSDGGKEKKRKKGKADLSDIFAFQGQLVYLFPVIILFTGMRFSSGLVLYWFTSTLFGIIQQHQATGLGGLSPWLQKLKKAK